MTVLEVIQRSTEFLTRRNVDSPRLQAELLLAHTLGLPRMRLYLEFERVLTPAQLEQTRELVRRRGQREPLQHIVGSTSFCGLEIIVNRHVLIPRPETELIAEQGWKFLLARAENGHTPMVVDIGTGSGCIAVALAAHCPIATVYGLDISPDALATARANVERHSLESRVHLLESNAFSGLSPDTRFDLIISNPPYIPSSEIPLLQPEVRDFEPRRALDGGADGLDFYRVLSAQAPGFLADGGRLIAEFGDGQANSVQQLFEEQNWIVDTVCEDYTHRPRFLVALRNRA